MNQPQYLSVTALTQYLKAKLENDPHLKKILLKGEISNFKAHSSGHFYFSLKDDKAQISAMMFSTYAKNINFMPKDGDKVLVEGYISLYEARGSYSISVYQMTLDGIGELFLKYENLRKEFEALGYFDPSLKKPIPKFPRAIGVITSPTGAVIQDIKNTVSRRYLLTKIVLYPALVQGEGSKDDLVKKIKKANEDNLVDVIILGRGGGSIEDLWSFNEAEVVVAIHESKIPIITAIGHETDTTLSDFVSDLRAPTPTAAAELATPNVLDLKQDIKENTRLLNYYINEKIKQIKTNLLNLDERLVLSSPKAKLDQEKKNTVNLVSKLNQVYQVKLLDLNYQTNLYRQRLISPKDKIERLNERLVDLRYKLNQNYQNKLTLSTYQFNTLREALKSINPLSVMERGFALTMKDDKVLTSIKDVKENDLITVELKDGKLKTKVIEKEVKSHE
ncbi:exodeoxyribonuclease VII large subunit [Acholeplasma equirhinis]|uniref:exodeoxyribonuclease VII large subunit n=1 Tax=Acholeplasma equirhinis TaxID=555393 RepID=UPI00197AB786|nr:exodeoxyribonuclease VII large subunit [Acholeplasma equirhinis]MBN3490208.1 exodeoxyribonuclease VII large subunit [Acholeplasma equirhinis]